MVVIDAALVRGLLADQFPDWAGLPVSAVEPGGWDNRTFRVGEAMLARLPSALHYAAQVDKEQQWLPRLAPGLPVAIPRPLARGEPGRGYPMAWSILAWLPGEPARAADGGERLGADIAAFLNALWRAPALEGPAAGAHSFHRGGDLAVYEAEALEAFAALEEVIDAPSTRAAWRRARASRWTGAPVWLHGDMAAGNLLLAEGRLVAVIDFGCCAVGDPACDLTIAWTLLDAAGAGAFRRGVDLDDGTWDRARGWALWKAAITLRRERGRRPDVAEQQRALIARILDEPSGATEAG